MPNYQPQLKSGFFTGVKTGWSSFIWISKIIIPVSFLVTLLQWTGWLDQLNFLLNPLMRLVNLPPEAALPVITGLLTNLYAVIAILTALPFTIEQMTLIIVFNLIAHNFILEGIIQHKSGISVIKILLIRLAAAILVTFIASQFLGDTSQSIMVPAELAARTPFLEVLQTWTLDTIVLLLKILGIIMFIMILLASARSLGWIEYSLKFFRPVMRILGLSDRAAIMWVAGTIFGLALGGVVIVEESKKGALAKEDLEYLHIFLGINHAMLEDPVVLLILGINGFWLWVPRFLTAIIAVQAYRALNYLKNKLLLRTA